MSQADAPNIMNPSRRLFIGSAVVASENAGDTALAAGGRPDQHIRDLCAEVRRLNDALNAAPGDYEDDPAYLETLGACMIASDDILRLTPATTQEMRAILTHALEEMAYRQIPEQLLREMVEALLASPVLAA